MTKFAPRKKKIVPTSFCRRATLTFQIRTVPYIQGSTLQSGVDKRVVSKRVVLADVPPERKPERGHVRQNHPFTKPPFYLPMTLFGVDKRVVSKRVVSADVPPERKPERGYVRQNHPFTKPPFYLPMIQSGFLPESDVSNTCICKCMTQLRISAFHPYLEKVQGETRLGGNNTESL